MDWVTIGARIRNQREYLGYTRDQFAELLDVTPKFCSDIELGAKGRRLYYSCKLKKLLSVCLTYTAHFIIYHAYKNRIKHRDGMESWRTTQYNEDITTKAGNA